MDKCPTVELGVQDTHLREKKKIKYRASHSPQKASKCKKGMYPLKRAKVELDFHHYYHHTPIIRHTCRRGMGYAKKICEEIKRGKCPEPQKRKK